MSFHLVISLTWILMGSFTTKILLKVVRNLLWDHGHVDIMVVVGGIYLHV
jgi:hypothetical protein